MGIFNHPFIGVLSWIWMMILMVWILMTTTTKCINTEPLSYYDYSPRYIEGDRVSFVKGVAVDNNPGLIFNSTFMVNFIRIQNLIPSNNYMVAIGFKSLSISINIYPGYISYWVPIITQNATSFTILAHCTDEAFMSIYQISYVVISKLFLNVYYYNLATVVNQVPTWPTYFDFNFTDSNIQPPPAGDVYFAFVSIYHFYFAQNVAAVPPAQILLVTVFQAAPTIWTVRVNAHGLYLYSFGVQGFIILDSLVNNLKKRNILLFSVYTTLSPSYFSAPIFSYSGISLKNTNSFFGLQYFNSDNNQVTYWLSTTSTQYTQFILTKANVNPSSMTIYMLAYLRNHCNDPYTYDENTLRCQFCMFYCLSCDGTQCLQCAQNFTLASNRQSCLCTQQLVSEICYAFDQSKMKGCVSAAISPNDSNNITCFMCSITQNLILLNNECICKQGYHFDSNLTCIEICGDGVRFYLACDDGNLINGDGCSDQCNVEMGFVCTLENPSKCRYQMVVNYEVASIMKNKNNSAVIKIKPKRNIKFLILYDELIDSTGHQTLNMAVDVNDSETLMQSTLMSVSDNEITLLIEYDFTIECFPARIDMNLTETIYTPESSQLKFNCCGDNQPLVISNYSDIFKKTNYIYITVGVLVLLLLGIGLCTPKYIGIEAISTLQLIFYSCLLITDAEKIPVGFETFVTFKYSTGFNNFFQFTNLLMNSNLTKKVFWMTLQKTAIQNYNLSFVPLFLASIAMLVTIVWRSKAQNVLEKRLARTSKQELETLQSNLKQSLKISNAAYNLTNHIVTWSILQVLAALSFQILINNNSVEIVSKNIFLVFGGPICLMASFLITMISLNNFKNFLISPYAWRKIREKPEEFRYRQFNFIYLIVMGLLIFILNEKAVFSLIPISLFALILHVSYMIILYHIGPYQQSLNVHKYGLLLCQIVYLLFLIVINFINFFGLKNEIISLIIVYIFLTFCGVIIVFTIVRLYYEYRYGPELQKKIQKEREIQKQSQLKNYDSELKRKMKSFENKFKQNLNQYQISRLQNKFLIENQLKEDLMNQEIAFLNERPNLSDQKKEAYYFEKFSQKPLDWLRKNKLEDYQKRIVEMEAKKSEKNEKKKRQMQSTEYKELTSRLRKQFLKSSNKSSFQSS